MRLPYRAMPGHRRRHGVQQARILLGTEGVLEAQVGIALAQHLVDPPGRRHGQLELDAGIRLPQALHGLGQEAHGKALGAGQAAQLLQQADLPAHGRGGHVQLARRFAHRTGSRHHRDKARLNYDPFKDLTPVAVLARASIVVVTAASSPCQTVDDLLAAARARPEAVRYATYGSGTAPHLSGVLLGYLRDEMQPCLEGLGFQVSLHANPVPGGGPFLNARRIEDAALPTKGDRRYGRGTADNKGQHSVVPGALAHVLRLRGQRPGYNLTVLLEMGEEAGSPGLAGFCAQQREALRADPFLASDGPRVHAERPTLFLGSRGALNFSLKVQPRPRCCCPTWRARCPTTSLPTSSACPRTGRVAR